MKLRSMTAVLTLGALFFTATLVARPRDGKPGYGGPCGGPGMEHGPMWRLDRMEKELGLNKEQSAKAKKIHEDYQAKIDEQHKKFPDMEKQLRDLLNKDPVNMGDVRSQLQKIADLQVEMRMLHVQMHQDFEAILTPEQKAKLRKIREDHWKERDERRAKGGRMGPQKGGPRS